MSQKIIFSPRYADQVAIGDEVLTQGYDGLSPTVVINMIDQFVQGKHCYEIATKVLKCEIIRVISLINVTILL